MHLRNAFFVIIINHILPSFQYISDDTDYILYATSSRIYRWRLRNSSQSEAIPIVILDNSLGTVITAIEYDVAEDCVLYAVHNQADHGKIVRYCPKTDHSTILASSTGFVPSIAFDWLSETLYFLDADGRRIDAFKLNGKQKVSHRPIVEIRANASFRPGFLAIHPQAGYLFWSVADGPSPGIWRARLNGTDQHFLMESPNLLDFHPTLLRLDGRVSKSRLAANEECMLWTYAYEGKTFPIGKLRTTFFFSN